MKKGNIKRHPRIVLMLISILILLIPDLILNFDLSILQICLVIIYKSGLFLFFYFFIFRVTKSFYYTYLIVGIPYLISSSVEVINVIALNSYTTLDNIKGLYFTLGSEVGEFFGDFYLYFLIPILIIIIYIYILIRLRSFSYIVLRQTYIIPLAFLSLLISISASFYILSTTPIYISGKNLADYNFKQYYLKQHPLSLYYRTYEFMYYKHRTNKFKQEKENFKFDVTNAKDTARPKIVVLIIGERTRHSNWSINGYARETNPCLKEQQNLISFTNNFSNANCTANSIPLIITQATPQMPDVAYKQKTIVSLFKEAGYETIWISSQANCFDFIDNKNEMDQLFEVYTKQTHTDLDIIPVFNEVVNKKSSKNKFIVINMLGGHGKIPKNFELFSPNSSHKDYPLTFSNSHIFINDYDNMICLQDFVLSQLIKATNEKSLSSILLFTADHGCNLFDNGKILFGYGSTNPTEKETHVPLIFWASDKFIKSNSMFNTLNNHKKMLTTNNNIFYTLADLSNIKYKAFEKSKSIANSNFIEPSSRYVFVNNCTVAFKKDNN